MSITDSRITIIRSLRHSSGDRMTQNTTLPVYAESIQYDFKELLVPYIILGVI
jgi:hypothetical protein